MGRPRRGMTLQLHHGDCLEVLRTLGDASVDAVVTDPPYYRVKDEDWDCQWDNPAAFLAWLDQVAEQWQRVLKPNGSLYCFASPQMAARVEVMLGQRFQVLNSLVWLKPQGRHDGACKEDLRSYFPATERIIFAEQFGADGAAMGGSGYETKCQELCCRVFQIRPLCERLGVTRTQIAHLVLSDYKNIESAKAQASNWILGKNIPNPIDFARLKTILPIAGEYEDLRREYEDLRREYEDLRRPFSVTRFDPFTDVWTFATVKPRPGKHPCEKPQSLLRHIINSSTRPGAVVLDSFAGSGSTGQACLALGRQFVGIERCHHWYAVASESLKSVQPDLLTPSPQQRISSSAAAGHQPSLALA